MASGHDTVPLQNRKDSAPPDRPLRSDVVCRSTSLIGLTDREDVGIGELPSALSIGSNPCRCRGSLVSGDGRRGVLYSQALNRYRAPMVWIAAQSLHSIFCLAAASASLLSFSRASRSRSGSTRDRITCSRGHGGHAEAVPPGGRHRSSCSKNSVDSTASTRGSRRGGPEARLRPRPTGRRRRAASATRRRRYRLRRRRRAR